MTCFRAGELGSVAMVVVLFSCMFMVLVRNCMIGMKLFF